MNIQHSSKTDRWFTPPWLIERARETLGRIWLDPASEAAANKVVKADRYFTDGDDGLSQDWTTGGGIFLNPPGGRRGGKSLPGLFWQKLMLERARKSFDHAIFLGFSLEQLQLTQGRGCESIMDFTFCVPKRRIRFMDQDGKEQRSPSHANVIAYVPCRTSRVSIFKRNFEDVGAISGAMWNRSRILRS